MFADDYLVIASLNFEAREVDRPVECDDQVVERWHDVSRSLVGAVDCTSVDGDADFPIQLGYWAYG